MDITKLFNYLQSTSVDNFENLKVSYQVYLNYSNQQRPIFLAANPRIFSSMKQIEEADVFYRSCGSSFIESVEYCRKYK
jgi:hypothetical protein